MFAGAMHFECVIPLVAQQNHHIENFHKIHDSLLNRQHVQCGGLFWSVM